MKMIFRRTAASSLAAFVLILAALSAPAVAQVHTPKQVWGSVTNANSGVPAPGDVTFSAFIQSHPGETLTNASHGCTVATVGAATQYAIECGNFLTQWAAGDVLVVQMSNSANGQSAVVSVTLNTAGAQLSDIRPTAEATVAMPLFDPQPGAYPMPADVTISCATPGTTVAYTADGSTPSRSHGTSGSSAVVVHLTAMTTLKVMAWKNTMTDSAVVSGTFYNVLETGTLSVTLSPQGAIDAGAKWRRVGAATWRGSGSIESGVPAGPQTVEFSDVADWTKPADQTVTIEPGLTTFAGSAYTTHRAAWLEITTLRMGLPASPGHDSFVLEGLCCMYPNDNAPETVTLGIGDWSLIVNSSSWRRAGKSNVYTCMQDGVVGRMTYGVNGTSKCRFRFSASRQTLQENLPGLPDVPVRLQLGSDFDETVTAAVTVKNKVARVTSFKPLPLFCTEKLRVTRNLRSYGHDAMSFTGRLFLNGDFDPAADGVTMSIGPYPISLPAGIMPAAKNGIANCSWSTPNGWARFQFNSRTHVVTVTATGIDASAMSQEAEVYLAITNHPGAAWCHGLLTARNRPGTVFTY